MSKTKIRELVKDLAMQRAKTEIYQQVIVKVVNGLLTGSIQAKPMMNLKSDDAMETLSEYIQRQTGIEYDEKRKSITVGHPLPEMHIEFQMGTVSSYLKHYENLLEGEDE